MMVLRILFAFLQNLNLFPSIPPTTNQRQLKNQIITTRLFIATLSLSLIVLIIYTSSVTLIQTKTHKDPSLQLYKQLSDQHAQSLICPCTHVSIGYASLLQGQYRLHQVCSSDFITKPWFTYLQRARGDDTIWTDDFRFTSFSTFPALSSLCSLANESIKASLDRFYTSHYLTLELQPVAIFQAQLKSLIDEFARSMIDEFLLSLRIVQNTTQANALITSLLLSADLQILQNEVFVFTSWRSYGDCSCAESSWCVTPSWIYHPYPNPYGVLRVRGMYTGCYILESLLQSTLECFYDHDCFHNLTSTMSNTVQPNVTLLDSLVRSNFSTTSTVGEMLEKLMVEEWQWTMLYDDYFEACRPSECRDIVKTRNNAIYIITTVIGLIGGLVTALKWISAHLVQSLNYFYLRRRGTIRNVMLLEVRGGKFWGSIKTIALGQRWRV